MSFETLKAGANVLAALLGLIYFAVAIYQWHKEDYEKATFYTALAIWANTL